MAFQAALRVDSGSRCAALSLPRDALAILPFYQIQADLDAMDVDHAMGRLVPVSFFSLSLLHLTGVVCTEKYHILQALS